jgi:hypothetical protein
MAYDGLHDDSLNEKKLAELMRIYECKHKLIDDLHCQDDFNTEIF